MNTRDCAHCGAPIPHARRADALYCSDKCGSRSRSAAFSVRHHERILANRELQNSKTERRILSRTKSRAKLAGIPFDLTLSDIVVPALCPILGIPLRERTGRGRELADSPSVDRKVPSLGYVRGNVGIISHAANLLKSNATLEHLKALVDYLERGE